MVSERFSDPVQTKIGFTITFSLLAVSFATATFQACEVNRRLAVLEQRVGVAAASSEVASVGSRGTR